MPSRGDSVADHMRWMEIESSDHLLLARDAAVTAPLAVVMIFQRPQAHGQLLHPPWPRACVINWGSARSSSRLKLPSLFSYTYPKQNASLENV